jgi:aryl-alcohol dehydrogenase-like predicted oxidoreductase
MVMTQQNNQSNLTLGCGLIRIGRVWGVDNKPVPSESEVQEFLEGAFELGIRFFDTAPAYGLSEPRLGSFLKNLTTQQRNEVTVATKFGEHWNAEKQEPFIEHTHSALLSSLEHSLDSLGKIEVLQLHKASISLLESDDIDLAFISALKLGISSLGASISDVDTGLKACSDKRLTYIQLPYNEERTELIPVIEQAITSNKKVLFNRPFAMGAIAKQSINENETKKRMIAAYKRIIDLNCPGVILTGTASSEHLRQNINNFESAVHG